MVELFANIGDPDQAPRSAASDLGLHCLPVTRLGGSSLQRVKGKTVNLFLFRVDLFQTGLDAQKCKAKKTSRKILLL